MGRAHFDLAVFKVEIMDIYVANIGPCVELLLVLSLYLPDAILWNTTQLVWTGMANSISSRVSRVWTGLRRSPLKDGLCIYQCSTPQPLLFPGC